MFIIFKLIILNQSLHLKLSTSQRTARGTLSSKIRSMIFQTFGDELPKIKTTDSPSEIVAWKKNPKVAKCYEELFKPIKKKKLFLTKIIEDVFTEDHTPNVQIAFAIAICTTFLNPKYERLQLNEKTMKRRVEHFLVGFCNFVTWNILRYSNYLFTNFYFLKYKLQSKEPIGPDDDYEEDEVEEDDNDKDAQDDEVI